MEKDLESGSYNHFESEFPDPFDPPSPDALAYEAAITPDAPDAEVPIRVRKKRRQLGLPETFVDVRELAAKVRKSATKSALRKAKKK